MSTILGNVHTHITLFAKLEVYENYAKEYNRRKISMD